MTRGKLKLEYITSDAERRASFKKRKKGLLKKARELCTLCGVPACVIIYGAYEPVPTVWPSPLDAQQIISRFGQLPETEQTQRLLTQESYTNERIHRSRKQVQKLERRNKMKDIDILMHRCMAGLSSPQNVPFNYITEMGHLADQKMQYIVARMEELQNNRAPEPSLGIAPGNTLTDAGTSSRPPGNDAP